jgi:carbamoyltransferase
VKFRESFRPFAPIVEADFASQYFELDRPSPYMLLVAPVRPDKHEMLPAITHVDGTARIQTVCPDGPGRLHPLLEAFRARTGCPVLLNTSFNLRNEPIVESPAQA